MSWGSTPVRRATVYRLRVDPDRLGREWQHAKAIMYDVRRQAIMSGRMNSLATAKTAAAKASAGADVEHHKEQESDVDRTVGRALKKGKKQREGLSETFVKLFTGFWSAVQSSNGGGHFLDLYKVGQHLHCTAALIYRVRARDLDPKQDSNSCPQQDFGGMP